MTRQQIITFEEEDRLLKACARRGRLEQIVICALDAGMRQGEILKMRWGDVDFDNRVLNVRAFNTKTMRERQVPMTARLTAEMDRLWKKSPKDKSQLVFGFTNNLKRSFALARREAGLLDVRFQLLRHTAATRLVTAHMPLSEVGRVLGHA